MNRVLLIIFSCSLFLSSCKVSRFVVYNFSNITDYKIFPERKVSNNSSPFVFATTNQPSTFGSFKVDGKEIPFEQYLDDNETVAFMIIGTTPGTTTESCTKSTSINTTRPLS